MSKRIIKFGKWNDKPMEWNVLYEDDFKMLIISETSIGNTEYSDSCYVGWVGSDIRKYLNDKFWNEAFTEEEKKKIMNTKLNDVNTKDNIFLISEDEAIKYLSSDDFTTDEYCWTRTRYGDYVKYFYIYNGSITYSWDNPHSYSHEIYPMMFLKK